MTMKSINANQNNSYFSALAQFFLPRNSERSLARDLGIRLVLAISFSLLCGGIAFIIFEARRDTVNLKLAVKQNATELASALALPLWSFNEVEIASIIKGQGASSDVSAITVKDDLGKVVSSFKKVNWRNDFTAAQEIKYKTHVMGKIIVSGSFHSLYVRAFTNMALSGLLTILAIVVTASLIQPLTRAFLEIPLLNLGSGIRKIASGRYREKIPLPPQFELARIIREVNFMAEKIESREEEIKANVIAATQLASEITTAQTVQRSMMGINAQGSEEKVALFYKPVETVSGDWVVTFSCDDRNIVYAMVGDVSGHGIAQGLVTMAAFGALQTLRPLIQVQSAFFSPATILSLLRHSLEHLLQECSLSMTVSILRIDLKSRTVAMSSAGHPLPILIRNTSQGMVIKPLAAKPQTPLGLHLDEATNGRVIFVDTVHKIEEKDLICLFSDGLTEARSEHKKQFGSPMIKSLKMLKGSMRSTQLLEYILEKFNRHVDGVPVVDDICLLVIDTKMDEAHDEVA